MVERITESEMKDPMKLAAIIPTIRKRYTCEPFGYLPPDTIVLPLRRIAVKGVIHNNKMGRMNGEVRDREKVMRGLKRSDTPILRSYQIYHNYIRPHSALGGRTPAEACGIAIEGENKWLTLIQNASHQDRTKK